MSRWTVAVTYGFPHIGGTVVEVESHTREHAAMVARASRKWPAGSTFCPRPADAGKYTAPRCWLDSAAGELFSELGALA